MSDFVERLGRELGDAVERLAERPRPPEGPAAVTTPARRQETGGETATPAPLGRHDAVRYAVAEGAERYRRIMNVLYREDQHFGFPLGPTEVGERLRRELGLGLDDQAVDAALAQLHTWGAAHRDFDTSLVSSARELRRNRFVYEITQAGKRVERLLAELDGLEESVGALDGRRLPAIRDALGRLAQGLAADEPNGAELRAGLERLLDEVGRLHAGASDFMSRLNRVIVSSEQLDEDGFEQCKGVLIDHLQGFRADLRRHGQEIEDALRLVDSLGPERLVAAIVASEELPALPGFTVEQLAAQRHAELLEQWTGVRTWFLGIEGEDSPWAALASKVVEAIRAVLDVAERLIDRRLNRASRAKACEHLARLVHDAATEADALALTNLAFGWAAPRHVGAPEDDHDALGVPGQISWLEAPPAPVTAHLRRPGARTPGAGRGAPVRQASALRERVLARQRAERDQLAAMLARFRGREPVRLSSIERLDRWELRHLLAWIGRAFESAPDEHGTRRAEAQDGRATILLRAPDAARRVWLETPDGRFETADYELRVVAR